MKRSVEVKWAEHAPDEVEIWQHFSARSLVLILTLQEAEEVRQRLEEILP